ALVTGPRERKRQQPHRWFVAGGRRRLRGGTVGAISREVAPDQQARDGGKGRGRLDRRGGWCPEGTDPKRGDSAAVGRQTGKALVAPVLPQFAAHHRCRTGGGLNG